MEELRISIINAVVLLIEDNKGLLCKIRCWARKAVIFVKKEKEKKGKERRKICVKEVKEEGTHEYLLVDSVSHCMWKMSLFVNNE